MCNCTETTRRKDWIQINRLVELLPATLSKVLLQKLIWAGTSNTEDSEQTFGLQAGALKNKSLCDRFKISHQCCLLKSFSFHRLVYCFCFCLFQPKIKKRASKASICLIVVFPAAIVGGRWSLLFLVSPGYGFPFIMSCASHWAGA